MSIHVNPDGSDTEGTREEPPDVSLYDINLTIGTATVLPGAAAAKAAGCMMANVQCDFSTPTGAWVRWRVDGTAPTSTVGWCLLPGASQLMTIYDAIAAKFTAAGTGTVILNIGYSL
jgi:hypothetical protein